MRTKRAVTLVDVVVVLAVLVVVVPLVLAGVRNGNEQSRIAQCLSNLGHAMQATHQYLGDYNDVFPLIPRQSGGARGVCTWTFGGKTADEYWRYESQGVFYIPATERPLNEYLLGARVQPDLMEGSTVVQRTPVPMLECPSDHNSHQRVFGGGGIVEGLSSYDDVGTSYHYNLSALYDANIDVWEDQYQGFVRLCRALVRDVKLGQIENVIWLHEDPLDWALSDNTIEIGNHREMSAHAAGFFDGHADYRYMDTRNWCGPGWSAINPNWVYRFGQPRPPIYYVLMNKNCDPQ